jgi:hypothetical protein
MNGHQPEVEKTGRDSADSGDLRVECYAGYRGEETPRRFYLGARLVEVASVVDRWLAPDHRGFKLADADGCLYILRQDTATERWSLTSVTA